MSDRDALGLDGRAFAEVLRRWFRAESLAAGAIEGLRADWIAFAADERALASHERWFAPAASPALGLAWWEERALRFVDGPPRGLADITGEDRLAMWLSTEAAARIEPRAHRPEWLAGEWQWRALRVDDEPPRPIAPPRSWRLDADGRLTVTGPDAERLDGASWRLHHAAPDELWLARPGDAHVEKWTLWRRGPAIELRAPGSVRTRAELERAR